MRGMGLEGIQPLEVHGLPMAAPDRTKNRAKKPGLEANPGRR